MDNQQQKQIIDFIEEEKKRIYYGKLKIEITITKGQAVNIKAETERSKRLD